MRSKYSLVLVIVISMLSLLVPVQAQGSKIAAANVGKLKLLASLPPQPDNILTLAFSPDGNMLASGGVAGVVKLWNVQDTSAVQAGPELKGHTKQIANVAFTPDGKTLASASYDLTLRLWDVLSGKQTGIQGKDAPLAGVDNLANAFSPDATLFVYNGLLANAWDVKNGKALDYELTIDNQGTYGPFVFAPDGKSLYEADMRSNKVYQVPVNGDESKLVITGPAGVTLDGVIALSMDGSKLAVTTISNPSIYVFDVKTGKALATLPGPDNGVINMVFSTDGSLLITSGYDGTQLWDVAAAKQIGTMPQRNAVLVFNPAGTVLAMGLAQESATVPAKIELWGIGQ